jgi:hypothetical protein
MAAVPFDAGVIRALELIRDKLAQKPDGGIVYVAVHGETHSGKSELMAKLKEDLESDECYVIASSGSPRRFDVEWMETFQTYALLKGTAKKVVYLFHCSWQHAPFPIMKEANPHVLVREVTGHGVDLTLGIFNPAQDYLSDTPYPGPYEVFISNPAAHPKP